MTKKPVTNVIGSQFTDLERGILNSIADSSPQDAARRARAILLLADGVRVWEVSKSVGVTEKKIYKWREEYQENGLASIYKDADSHTCELSHGFDLNSAQKTSYNSDRWTQELDTYGDKLSYGVKMKIMKEYGPLRWVFDNIETEDFYVLYSDHGRGPSSLRELIMMPIMLTYENLSVERFLTKLACDASLRFVFGGVESERIRLSATNYYYFENRLQKYYEETGIYLYDKVFNQVVGIMAPDMGLYLQDAPDGYILNTRSDTHMVAMFAQHLPRAGIVYQCNKDALFLLKRVGMDNIIPDTLHHYFNADDKNRIIYHNDGILMDTLTSLLTESVTIRNLMSEDIWEDYHEYKCLTRCIEEQGIYNEEENTIVPRDSKDIAGKSMQTPRDTNATCRTKNRRYFQGDIGFNKEAINDQGYSLIIETDLSCNLHSDVDFQKESINKRSETSPIEMTTTDGGFYSMENSALGAQRGVIMIPTGLTGSSSKPLYSKFQFSEDGHTVKMCPDGKSPVKQVIFWKNSSEFINAKFDKDDCKQCKYHDQCPMQEQKKANKVIINLELAKRAEIEDDLGSEEYKQKANERNGAETIPSILNRRYNVQRIMSFRGVVRRMRYFAAVICLNVRKYEKYKTGIKSRLFTYEAAPI